jgi:hypothetical protein
MDATYKKLYEDAGGGDDEAEEAKLKVTKKSVNYTSLTVLRRMARIGYHVCLVVVVSKHSFTFYSAYLSHWGSDYNPFWNL